MENFYFYWKQDENNEYILYSSQSSYPLGTLKKWRNDCNNYYFKSDFFNFYEDYSEEDNGFEDINELLEIVRLDLINDVKTKIQLMTEWMSALCMG